MSCGYNYGLIFQEYGSSIRELLLNDNTKPNVVYESKPETPQETYYGLLVWQAQKYYNIISPDNNDAQGADEYANDVGFFIIPEFGDVSIIPNLEYKQIVAIPFDSNTDPDYDPYGIKIITFIDWFINKHAELIERINYVLSDDTRLFSHLSHISKPIYDTGSSLLVRRSVLITLRYCKCG